MTNRKIIIVVDLETYEDVGDNIEDLTMSLENSIGNTGKVHDIMVYEQKSKDENIMNMIEDVLYDVKNGYLK